MNLIEIKESVINSPASMFTKDDVLALITKIESTPKNDTEEFERFCECLEQFMDNSQMPDFLELNYDFATIDLYNREITVTDVPVRFDNDTFMYEFKNAIDLLK
jgi:hypothetical protein